MTDVSWAIADRFELTWRPRMPEGMDIQVHAFTPRYAKTRHISVRIWAPNEIMLGIEPVTTFPSGALVAKLMLLAL